MIHDFKGKTAIVTGAASGIGAACAELLARKGMNVVLADIQAQTLAVAAETLSAQGLQVAPCVCDVSEADSVRALADFAERAFGDIHLMFNNAGVAMHGVSMHQMPLADWRWVDEVNIQSVVHAIHHVLPRMLRHGSAGWFINTASIGGLQVNPAWLTGAYSMTKFAVVALSEALENELSSTPVRAAVLCPGAVATNLADARTRPERLGGATERPAQDFLREAIARNGVSPLYVAECVWRAIEDGEFYILTDAAAATTIQTRHRRIEAALARAAGHRGAQP
ncbi:1-deoxy-11-beta-hydroxypentalenate dehydrogenase [Xylophilus ampelinus]|nr:1-deoxy-11-beta-hydroxypentalenate dehydrogenase [Xylophilus ampelinus]